MAGKVGYALRFTSVAGKKGPGDVLFLSSGLVLEHLTRNHAGWKYHILAGIRFLALCRHGMSLLYVRFMATEPKADPMVGP